MDLLRIELSIRHFLRFARHSDCPYSLCDIFFKTPENSKHISNATPNSLFCSLIFLTLSRSRRFDNWRTQIKLFRAYFPQNECYFSTRQRFACIDPQFCQKHRFRVLHFIPLLSSAHLSAKDSPSFSCASIKIFLLTDSYLPLNVHFRFLCAALDIRHVGRLLSEAPKRCSSNGELALIPTMLISQKVKSFHAKYHVNNSKFRKIGRDEIEHRPWPAGQNPVLRFSVKSLFGGNSTSLSCISSLISVNHFLQNRTTKIVESIPVYDSMISVLSLS
jgi:hypothetical protein